MSQENLILYTEKLVASNLLLLKSGTGIEALTEICGRAFIALIYAIVLEINKTKKYMSETVLSAIYQQFIIFAEKEYCAVAFMEVSGWIHLYAHFADALQEFFAQESISSVSCHNFFEKVALMIVRANNVFTECEEERLVFAFYALITSKKMSAQELYLHLKAQQIIHKKDMNSRIAYINLKNVIRALEVFLLIKQEMILEDITRFENDMFYGKLLGK